MRILGLTDLARVMGPASLFQAVPLPVSVGSMRVRSMESPTWPFTLSMAQRVWAAADKFPTAFQALAAPKPRMYWFVWVASTVQDPAQAWEPLRNASRSENFKTFFVGTKNLTPPSRSVILDYPILPLIRLRTEWMSSFKNLEAIYFLVQLLGNCGLFVPHFSAAGKFLSDNQ